MSIGGLRLATCLVAVMLAAVLGPVAAPLHDLVGMLVRGPAVPAVVVEVEGPLGRAASAALAAGARSVVAALPAGHPHLDGVTPEPIGLTADPGGRIRWFGKFRLPLPEALDSIVHLSVAQLDPSNPAQLAGRHVVLDLPDPLGVPAYAPGGSRAVDRAEILAVALGTASTGRGLLSLPLVAVAVLCGVAALGVSSLLDRMSVAAGIAASAGATCGWIVLAMAARMVAVDLPVEAAVAAVGVPLAVRIVGSTQRALLALDQVALQLGAAAPSASVRSGIETRATMAHLFAPDCSVAAWAVGPSGALERVVVHGPETFLPKLNALPGDHVSRSGWRVEPVLADGAVIGALAVGTDGALPADIARMLEAVARAPLHMQETRVVPSRDPMEARLQLVSRGVDRALKEAETWRAVLGRSGLPVGLFELGGDLVSAGATLRARMDPASTNPLLDLLVSITGFDTGRLGAVLRRAIAEGTAPRRIPSKDGTEEVVIGRVESEGRVVGLLVHVHDVRPHLRLDRLKSNLVMATTSRLRGTIAAVARDVDLAQGADPEHTEARLARVQRRLARAQQDLDQTESLASTQVGENPIQPVYLEDAVQEATTALDPARQAQLEITLPEISTPVSARSAPLVRALGGLLGMLAGQGGRVRVAVWPEDDGMRLALEDDSGGLPTGMLERLVDPESPSEAGGAVREIRAMGGTFSRESHAGSGTRLVFAFPYF